MKYLTSLLLILFFYSTTVLNAQTEVSYHLSYDQNTQAYTVSMTSNTDFNPPLSRLTSSTQVTVVVPQIPGSWQLTNLTALTNLNWGVTFLDGNTQSLSDDYLFFAPSNAGTYSPFPITNGQAIPLFSFQTSSGCAGDLALYDNDNDPLNSIPTINGDNNIVILGAGPGNVYLENTSGNVSCVVPCEAEAGSLGY